MIGGFMQGKWKSMFTIGLTFLFFPLSAAPALADDSNLSSFSASVADSTPSATTTYVLSLTTNTTLASGTVIAIMMDASVGSVDLSQVTASNISSTLSGSGVITTGGFPMVTYTLSSAAAAGSYTLSIANVVNPSTSDDVTVYISTAGTSGLTSENRSSASITIGSGSGDGGDGGNGFGERETGENTIAVTVTDENGAPLSSQIVVGYCGMSYDEATTDSNGTASLEDLTSGNCGVELNSSQGYYAEPVFLTFASSGEAQSASVELTGVILDTSVTFTITDVDGNLLESVYLTVVDEQGRQFANATNSDGEVTIPVDYGTYTVIGYYDDSTQYFPDTTITVSEDSSTQTVSIQLEAFSSFIRGSVTDSDGNALSTPSILVISDDGDIRFSQGEEDGSYQVGVNAGVYTIKAESSGYANGAKRDITVKKGQTKSGQDIELDVATNTLNLTVVDENGATLTTINGGVMCKDPNGFDPVSVYFTQMSDGEASFILPDGTVQCSLFTSGYATASPTFSLADGETEAGQIEVISYDSTLLVSLVDENGDAVNDVRFGVFGQTNNGTKTLNGFSMGGQTSMGAAAGTYTLRAFIMSGDYTTDYTDPTVVTLVEGENTTASIQVFEKSANLSGTILDSAGDAVSAAAVTAKSTNENKPFSFSTVTDEDGNYSMNVVPGTYLVTAAKEGSDSLPAIPQTAKLKDGAEKELDASLEKTNATLNVTPLESAEGDASSGSCYAFEPDGTYVSAELTDGSVDLEVNPGEWHYGCRVIIDEKVYTTKSEGITSLAKGDETSVETEVTAGGTGFENVVYQFSATSDTTLDLPDGTTIFIPANTLDTSGSVSITASSAAEVGVDDDQYPIMPISLEARDSNGALITGTFNGQVTITFHYTSKQLSQNGVNEEDLEGQSFKNDAWSTTDQGFTVKQGADYVSITTNHFSTFGLVAPIHLPKKATNLATKKITTSSAKVTWEKPKSSKVETYTLQVRPFNSTDTTSWVKTKNLTDTATTVTDLDSGVKYEVRVKACNSQGCGKFTEWKPFTTKESTGS